MVKGVFLCRSFREGEEADIVGQEMKIFVADSMEESILDQLRSKYTVEYQPKASAQTLPSVIGDAEVLVVRSTVVNVQCIQAAKNLKLVIRAGAGYNTICTEDCAKKGIAVCNTPGTNSAAVAELTMMHIINCDRQASKQYIRLADGHWEKNAFAKAKGLNGNVIGVLGRGNIASRVITAAKAFGMKVAQWSGRLTREDAEKAGTIFCATPEDLARISDFVTVHLPKTPQTDHMLNKKFFDAMKDGAVFVNAARGDLMNTKDLIEAIDKKHLRVALDTYENEPTNNAGCAFEQTDLVKKCYSCTMHCGASTDEASLCTGQEVVNVIAKYVETGEFLHKVN